MKPHRLPSLALARLLSLLVIVATAASACSFPTIGGLSPTLAPTIDLKALEATGTPAPEFPPARPPSTTPEATPGALPAPSPTPALDFSQARPPADLPPRVVQVDPPSGADLLPGSALVIVFNQPMDRASVEAAFRAGPSLAGAITWDGDASLRYAISGSLEPGARVTVEIGETARALNGQVLGQPWQAVYVVPGPARISRRLPAPGSADALPGSPVAVAFDRPLARAEDLSSLPAAFTLDPPAGGRGEWAGPSAFVFYPQPPLPGGAAYTVRLNADLFSRPGAALAEGEPLEWTFTVSPPRLLAATPAPSAYAAPDGVVSMEFSQPMDRASVEASFSLVDPKGQPAAGQFTWREDGAAFTFTPAAPLDRGAEYTLLLLGAATALDGAQLGADQVQRFTTFPPLEVTRSDPAPLGKLALGAGGASVKLAFNAPLKPGQDLAALLVFDPPLANPRYTLSPDGMNLEITGDFRAEMGYFLTAAPGLLDRFGGPLSKPFRFQFTTTAVPAYLDIPALAGHPGAKMLFVPAGESVIPAKAVNVGRIEFTRAPLALASFFSAAASGLPAQDPSGGSPETWSRLVYIQPNRVGDVALSLSQANGPLEPGLYFYNAVPTQLDGRPLDSTAASAPPLLLVISHAQVTVKVSPAQAVVWVAGSDRRPLEGQPVTFSDARGTPLGSCTTDSSGVCQSQIPARPDLSAPVYAVISEVGRADFSLGSSAWSAGIETPGAGQPLLCAAGSLFITTDRSVYRSGQVVNYRAILRSLEDGRYILPEQPSLEVALVPLEEGRPAGEAVTAEQARLSAFGSAEGSILLPQGLPPGRYALKAAGFEPGAEIVVTGDSGADLILEAAFAAPSGLVGDDLVVTFTARYAFGAPAAGLPVRWALYALPEPVTLPGGLESGVQTVESLDQAAGEGGRVLLLEGEARADSNGLAALRIPGGDFSPALKPGTVYRLSLEAVVVDGQAAAQASARAFPSQVIIGLKPESWVGTAGQPLVVTIKTADWEGAPAAAQSLRALFQKILWSQETSADGRTQSIIDYADAGSTDFVTSEKGEARLQFTPNEPGVYRLEISGGGAVTSRLLWVGGEGPASWPRFNSPRLPLLASAIRYQPGEQASILIPNPFGSPAQALITVERERVLRWEVVEVTGANLVYTLPLTGEDAPNVTVSVMLLGQEENRPAFRFGTLSLEVAPSAQTLHLVLATSPAEPRQGDEVALALLATGSQGEPVTGEFSIAVVSKGAESGPGMVDSFYAPRPPQVTTGAALAIYARRPFFLPSSSGEPPMPPSALAAAGKAPGETVYWNASVITAENGEALVTFRLPARPGDWVVIARGITADSRVGEARLDLSTAQSPLSVAVEAPSFVTVGDRLELAAWIANHTGGALSARVTLRAAGFAPDGQVEQVVEIPPGESRRAAWLGVVAAAPELALTVSADAGDLSAVAEPEGGAIPIRRVEADHAFAAYGVLPEEGSVVVPVSLPGTFEPLGGMLRVSLSPGLPAALFDRLNALQAEKGPPGAAAQLLADLVAFEALQDLGVTDPARLQALKESIPAGVNHLASLQNEDGGWGLFEKSASNPSDPALTASILRVLARAQAHSQLVPGETVPAAKRFLAAQAAQVPDLDLQAWIAGALASAGSSPNSLEQLYQSRDSMTAFGRASLALALVEQDPADERLPLLLEGLAPQASLPGWQQAVTAYAIARASSPGGDALRQVHALITRGVGGRGSSAMEQAWTLLAMAQAARAGLEDPAGFAYAAEFNGVPLADQPAPGGYLPVESAQAGVPLSAILKGRPNGLTIRRGAGGGILYYHAWLELYPPVENVSPAARGVTVIRDYFPAAGCGPDPCARVLALDRAQSEMLDARLTVILEEDAAGLVVEEFLPAGAEAVDLFVNDETAVQPGPANLFADGWGRELFRFERLPGGRLRFTAARLPAGTYMLAYRLVVRTAGDLRVPPARAWRVDQPELVSWSRGEILSVR